MTQLPSDKHARREEWYWLASASTSMLAMTFAAVGIFFSYQALQASIAGSKAAIDSANSALAQQKIMLDQEKRSLRPYINLKSIVFTLEDKPDKLKRVWAHVQLSNGGQTPAYRALFRGMFFIDSAQMSSDMANRVLSRLKGLQPSSEVTLSKDELDTNNTWWDTSKNDNQFKQFGMQQDVSAYFVLDTEYQDTFQDIHWRHDCWRLEPDFFTISNLGSMSDCPFLNDAD